MVHNEGIEERATIKRDSGGVLQLVNSYYLYRNVFGYHVQCRDCKDFNYL